eukprot:scaffold1515_cov119-Isochrysis_galbana.AAC.3
MFLFVHGGSGAGAGRQGARPPRSQVSRRILKYDKGTHDQTQAHRGIINQGNPALGRSDAIASPAPLGPVTEESTPAPSVGAGPGPSVGRSYDDVSYTHYPSQAHTPFGGVRSLANTYRRCGANWAPPYNSYSHTPLQAGSCQVCRSMKGEGDRGLGEIGESECGRSHRPPVRVAAGARLSILGRCRRGRDELTEPAAPRRPWPNAGCRCPPRGAPSSTTPPRARCATCACGRRGTPSTRPAGTTTTPRRTWRRWIASWTG